MKIIDSKGRLFGKVSLIDILVIIVIIGLGVGIFVRNFVLETTAANNPSVTLTYRGKISSVNDLLLDNFHVGDDIFDNSYNDYYGTITKIEIVPAEEWKETANGDYIKVKTPNRSDVYLTIEAEGMISDGRYLIGRMYELEPNYKFYMYSKYIKFNISIMEIY